MRTLLIASLGLLPLSGRAQPPAEPAAPAAQDEMGTLVIEAADGIEVRLDDAAIGQTPLPGPWTLPAGEHIVELRPASGEPTVRRVTIVAGRREVIRLAGAPAPVEAPAAPVAPDPPPAAVSDVAGPGFSLATGGYVAAGLGVLGVGAGVALGLLADGYAADARDLDRASKTRADQQGLVDQADAAAFGANVAFGAGGLLLVGGVAMLLLASDGPLGDGPVTVAPTAGGAVIEGRF